MADKKLVRTNPRRFGDSTTADINPAGQGNQRRVPARPGIRTPDNPTRSMYARKGK